MKYKNILFDIDNTLVDSATIASNILYDITIENGFHVQLTDIRKLIGVPTTKILEQLNIKPTNEMLTKFTKQLSQHKDELRLFNGVQDLLAELHTLKIKTGIVTSRTASEVNSDLHAFPEITASNIIVTSDKTKLHKPSGAPLEYAMRQYNLEKNQTIYIGDTIYDMQSAENAGIAFASATWGALPTTDFSKAIFKPERPLDVLQLVL